MRILGEMGSARVLRFNSRDAVSSRVNEISEWLLEITSFRGGNANLSATAEAFSSYSVRTMTTSLGAVFDDAVSDSTKAVQNVA